MLYIDPTDTTQPSKEFKANLIIFYVFLDVFLLIMLSFSIMMRFSREISPSIMNYHIIFLILIGFAAHLLLIGLYRYSFLLYNNKYFFAGLGAVLYIYVILGNEPVISTILGLDSTKVKLPTSLAIICLTIFVRLVLFDAFFIFTILCFGVIILYIGITFSLSQDPVSSCLAEFCLIGCFMLLQIIETQQVDIRTRQLFWRLIAEENLSDEFSNIPEINIERKNSAESIAQKINHIKAEIKHACSVILYKDVKRRLKLVLNDINSIEKHIEIKNYEYFKIEADNGLDEDDKEFISQNYLKAPNLSFRRRDVKSSTIIEMPERRSNSVFKHYGVDELESVLSSVGKNWNFDIWFVYNTTGHSIQVLAKYLFQKWNLCEVIKTNKIILDAFFGQIELGYKVSNPYHNACHAADVCHTLLYFVFQSELCKKLTPHDSVVSIISALGHDICHPGVTNRFLVNNRDPLAIKYNDISVLESMHSSTIFSIMDKPEHNILSNVSADDWVRMRKLLIEMVLETDMSRHFEILGKFKAKMQLIFMDNPEDKSIVLGMGLKCADIGHSAKSFELHEKWTNLVCEEFFRQGDVEKEKGQAISMYCDRLTTDIAKSQAGFIKNICLPLYELWAVYLDSETVFETCMKQLDVNFKHWDAKFKERKGSSQIPEREIELPLLKPSSSARDPDD